MNYTYVKMTTKNPEDQTCNGMDIMVQVLLLLHLYIFFSSDTARGIFQHCTLSGVLGGTKMSIFLSRL